MITEINGHRDKRSSEIITQKLLKGLNNNITQIMVGIHIVKHMLLFSLCIFVIHTT